MSSTFSSAGQTRALRPGAGPHEVELYVTKTRDDLDRTMEELRERLDVRPRAARAWESFRRDYRKAPAAFNAAGIGAAVIAIAMIAVTIGNRGRNG